MLFGIPILLYAQSSIESSLLQNASVVEAVSLISPMAISPFWTLFLTSLASNFGFGNEYIATNPMLANIYIVIASFILVLITTIPNLSKFSKPLGLAAKFLENKAGYFIYILTLIAPYLMQASGNSNIEMSGFAIGGYEIPSSIFIIALLAIPYFLVVVTVRYFLEILIFLSPIPLLDALFEFAKKVFTFGLVLIYFFFPKFGLILTLLIFVAAFFLFKKAKKFSNFFQYIYVEPMFSKLFGKDKTMVSENIPNKIKAELPNINLAIEGLTGKKYGAIPAKSSVWFIKNEDDLFICQSKLFRKPIVQQVSLQGNLRLGKEVYYHVIDNESNDFKLLVNNTYKEVIPEIVEELYLNEIGSVGLAKKKEALTEQGVNTIKSLLNIFNTDQLSKMKKSIIEE